MSQSLLKMQNITKIFRENSLKAVDSADLTIVPGEIHSIIGENGAGKSTLMHILAGELIPNTGSIQFSNKNVNFKAPLDALKVGIGMLHQNLKLIPELTVLENIILGIEPASKTGLINKKEAYYRIENLYTEFDLYVDPNKTVKTLTLDEKQKTALLSILYHDIKLLILDEPTTFFSEKTTDSIHNLIIKLKNRGKSIIIITHKLKEAIAISDRITVMKSGKTVKNICSSNTEIQQLSSLMIGNESHPEVKHNNIVPGDILFEAKNLTFKQGSTEYLKLNFKVRKNEILVITGIRGNGLEYLEKILSGALKQTEGEILYRNKFLKINEYNLRKIGAGYIPSDRINTGASIKSTISENLILLKYKFLSKWGILNFKKIKLFSDKLIKEYSIKGFENQKVETLSGGNIQRVMIAREMEEEPELFIFAEPSRGLDITSKRLIYEKINKLKNNGSGVLVISSDIDEAIQISDRILILYKGKEAASLKNKNIDRSFIGKIMLGLEE